MSDPKSAAQSGLSAMIAARQATLAFFSDIPADKVLAAPVPGGNPPLWVLAHLAWTENLFLTKCAGKASMYPSEWEPLFAMKSVPPTDLAAVPPAQKVIEVLAAIRESLLAWYASATPEQLTAPLSGGFAAFAPSYADLPARFAWHEGLHAGQMTVCRKALGLPPKFA